MMINVGGAHVCGGNETWESRFSKRSVVSLIVVSDWEGLGYAGTCSRDGVQSPRRLLR